ncbi:MAG TPA: arsenic resistance N-acetyltransferase ArsN2 [Woeseiaceae bacterium]
MTRDWRIRNAQSADWPQSEALLVAENLPVSDIGPGFIEHFFVAESSTILGVIGLEVHGQEGLVRSLVTSPHARARGIGSALYGRLELHARALGIVRLWLLTESADGFFAAQGFAGEQRTSVPAWLAETQQFRELCPASARVLSKALV